MRIAVKWLAFLGTALPGAVALGQQVPTGDTILVTGLRSDSAASGQAVSIFGRDAIEAVQGADLTRVLERAPGVTLNRNGGPGAFTALHVRGSESEQVLVLIDGVRAADPASPGGGFDLGNLLAGNLAKVELQRGSNSTIWGSQAMGGVLAVTTGRAPGVSASAEYGAYDTAYLTGGGQVALGPATLSAEAAHFDSAGYSAAHGGHEPDGFRQTEIAARGDLALAKDFSAFALGRYAEGHLDIDGFPAPAYTLADTAEYQDTRQWSGGAGVHYLTRGIDLTALVSAARTERFNYDPALQSGPTYSTDGESRAAELRGRWRFMPGAALNFGVEQAWSRFSTLFDPARSSAAMGVYGQLDYDRGPLHLAAGARRDDNRDFGGHWSLGADAAYRIGAAWRLTASYGEGFKAPTLFQLFSDYGNTALKPEVSRSIDTGLHYRTGPVSASLIAFRRDTANLIGFVSCFGVASGICAGRPFGTYDNIGRARAQGVEGEARITLSPGIELGAAYAYVAARDRTPGAANDGKALPRRPRHALTLTADLSRGRWRAGADVRIVSDSFDDAANTVRLAGYSLVTLRGEWQASRGVTLYARLENALDAHYQTAAGYATAGRSAYLGARARL